MDNIVQEVAGEVAGGAAPHDAVWWIMVGVVLAIQVADKVILWTRQYKRSNGNTPAEYSKANEFFKNSLAINTLESDVKHLIETVEKHVIDDKENFDKVTEHLEQCYKELKDIRKNGALR